MMTEWERDSLLVELRTEVKNIKALINEKEFVRRDEFLPVKMIAYGIVSLALLAVLTAVLQLVLGGDISAG